MFPNVSVLEILLFITMLWPLMLLLGHSFVITWIIGIINCWLFIAYGFFEGNLWYSVGGAASGIFCSWRFYKSKAK